MRVTVSIRDKVGGDFIKQEKEYIKRVSEEDTKKIAETARDYMKFFIMDTSDQPSGHLASLITADKVEGGWGVGDIPTLDNEAKYWLHINVGSIALNANWDHYLPKGFWSNGRWIESDTGYAGVKPKTPIKAKNYIEKTISLIDTLMPAILEG